MASEYAMRRNPTVARIMDHVFTLYKDIPKLSARQFRVWMKRWGFNYKKADKTSFLIDPNRGECTPFIATYRKAQMDGREIVFGGETWINPEHSASHAWQWSEHDKDGKFVGFKGSMKQKYSADEKVILNHFMTKNGFINGSCDFFIKSNNSNDYIHEMNHYHEYVRTKLGPNLPDRCAIILDRATYYSVKTQDSKYPTQGWRKDDILEWFLRMNICSYGGKCITELTDQELLALALCHKPIQKYEVDEILKYIPHSSGIPFKFKDIIVIRQPVKHCFFNAAELIWAKVKSEVAKNNGTCKAMDVLELAKCAIEKIPMGYHRLCFAHVEGVISAFEQSGQYISTHVNPLIMKSGGNTNEESHSGDESPEAMSMKMDNAPRVVKSKKKSEVNCGCGGSCNNKRCSCKKSNTYCSPACKCSQQCSNQYQLLLLV